MKKSRPTTVAGRNLAAAGREARKHVDTDAFVAFFRSAAVKEVVHAIFSVLLCVLLCVLLVPLLLASMIAK